MYIFPSPYYRLTYKKVLYMEKMIEELGKLDQRSVKDVDRICPPVILSPLREFAGNVTFHEFVKLSVERTQQRFDCMVKGLLARNVSMEELEEKMRSLGRLINFRGGARDAFIVFSDVFLDGMPEERGVILEILEDDFVGFRFNTEYCKDTWGEQGKYYRLMKAWMEGFLSESASDYSIDGSRVEFYEKDYALCS